MGVGYGPSTAISGLAMCVDAGNPRSYPGSGGTWSDISRNNNDFTAGGVFPTYNAGGWFSFNGSTNHVRTAGANNLNITNNITIEAWIRQTTWVDYGSILVFGTPSGEQWSLNSQNIQRDTPVTANGLSFGTNWPGTWYLVYPTVPVSTGRWWCVHITFASGVCQWFLNGSLDSTANLGISSLTAVSSPYATIGANIPGGIEYFNGDIACVKVYNRVLTSIEVQNNFLALKGRFGI